MLFKNTLIKISKSCGRYLSIFMIVMVGVGFYAGIRATVPDMINMVDQYYKEHNLLDFKVVSSMGLTDEDVKALKSLSMVKTVIPSYSLDVLDQDKAIRVHAIEASVNTVKLLDGRMPSKENECVADGKIYKIGDHIKIASDTKEKEDNKQGETQDENKDDNQDDKQDDNQDETDSTSSILKNTEFIVVGTVESVLYLAEDYGNTTVGDGKLASFIFVDKSNFDMEAYTEIDIIASGDKETVAYSKEYDDISSQLNDELISIKADRENARYQQILKKAKDEIDKNQVKLNDEKAKNEKKLSDAKAELDDNAQKLKDAKEELAKNEEELNDKIEDQNAEFASAKTKIEDGWAQINSNLTKYNIKKDEIDPKITELDSALEQMKTQLNQLPTDSQEYIQLSAQISQYTESYQGLQQLKTSMDTLTANEEELNQGIQTFNKEIDKAKTKIADGKNELADKEQKLDDGYEEYNENLDNFNTEMADAWAKLDTAMADLSEIEKPQWFIFDREASVGYDQLKAGIDVISSVAAVFPLFFILIGMLMTSNTMARMIAEERSELGTLTSLGYKDSSIITTYLLYVLSASGLGALAGFFVGCRVIPPLIYVNFQYVLPPITIQYNMATFALILAITFAIMTLVTIVSCNRELKHKPATLMRPAPPKNGQTILLERVGPIWKHFSFTWKVTIRNMFRYKKRAFMTIIGVAGCTSLLLVGFGLRDSMNGVAQKQYREIFRYDDMIILKSETKQISNDLQDLLTKEHIKEPPLLMKQSAFQCITKDKSLDTFLIVPENEEVFYPYFHLADKATGNILSLKNDGVIITQKLAQVFKAKKGSTITIKDADNQTYRLTVSAVAENYTSNYIYMNSSQYSKVFGETAAYNTIVSNHNGDQKTLAEQLMNSDLVINVVFTDDVLQKALESSKSLNGIIVLIVVVASLLAIIVLYNLTSINISERMREIATLKVLGFTDEETNAYIYREAFLLTLISIGIGLIMGIYLHRFVIDVIEGYASLFFKTIKWPSFVIAGFITIVFSVVMQIVTYIKLRTIDMIESLKSVE